MTSSRLNIAVDGLGTHSAVLIRSTMSAAITPATQTAASTTTLRTTADVAPRERPWPCPTTRAHRAAEAVVVELNRAMADEAAMMQLPAVHFMES